jgi:hypothetical protein
LQIRSGRVQIRSGLVQLCIDCVLGGAQLLAIAG